VELVHVEIVAAPGDGASGGLDADAGESADRAARAVIARDPFGKDERLFAFVDGNLEMCVVDVAGSVGEVYVQADGLRGSEWSEE